MDFTTILQMKQLFPPCPYCPPRSNPSVRPSGAAAGDVTPPSTVRSVFRGDPFVCPGGGEKRLPPALAAVRRQWARSHWVSNVPAGGRGPPAAGPSALRPSFSSIQFPLGSPRTKCRRKDSDLLRHQGLSFPQARGNLAVCCCPDGAAWTETPEGGWLLGALGSPRVTCHGRNAD